jgi:hypothetical protein
MVMRSAAIALATAPMMPAVASAQAAPFDLAGPGLRVSVKRQGTTLPISHVPNLAVGDKLAIQADLPADQSAHYLLVAVFLRGATNPPPKDWFFRAETWQRKDKRRMLNLTVPEGAHQLALFLVPETGGDYAALTDAVRGRPGAFVRASQDLNQAMLDRTRLEAFVEGIKRQDDTRPEKLEDVSPVLARSLSIKLNAECLQKLSEVQASCLTQDREALVLNDVHSTTMTEALTGAPADLALQVAATPAGGLGYYSPYIGVVRDLARVLGAFHTAEFQYIPALAVTRDDAMHLLLNAVPSFREPKSVLVTALPPVKPAQPPPLQAVSNTPAMCAGDPNLVLPVNGGPLIYSTRYAHSMAVRVKTRDGRSISIPVTASAERGGFVIDRSRFRPGDFGDHIDATLQGYWGFQPFDGPRFSIANASSSSWRLGDGQPSLMEGADGKVTLTGGTAQCVERVSVTSSTGANATVQWQPAADGLTFALPATAASPGVAKVTVKLIGSEDAATIDLPIAAKPAPPPAIMVPPVVTVPPPEPAR